VELGFRIPSLLRGISPAGPRNQMVIGPDPAPGELALRGRSRQSFALTPLSFRWTAATWSRVPRVDSGGGHHHCYHHGSANVWRSYWINWALAQAATTAPATSSTLAPRLAADDRGVLRRAIYWYQPPGVAFNQSGGSCRLQVGGAAESYGTSLAAQRPQTY